MIFREELAEKILRGEKTATRRVMNDKPNSPWYRHTTRYPVGMVFAVQPGRAKHGIGKARITASYMQAPIDITYEQAREEGFKARSEFFAVISQINPGINLYEPMHVREFELVPAGGQGLLIHSTEADNAYGRAIVEAFMRMMPRDLPPGER